jgi:tetratricopeptide (TPR) repeat protein
MRIRQPFSITCSSVPHRFVAKAPFSDMQTPNLHTIDSDVLYNILVLSPNLDDLRNLICTHPAIHHVFLSRRRLILRRVYGKQFRMHPRGAYWYLKKAEEFIASIEPRDVIAAVAFREAIWRFVGKLIHTKQTLRWATSLLNAYHEAELKDEELAFAQRIMAAILNSPRDFEFEVYGFARTVFRTYAIAGLKQEIVDTRQRIRDRIDARSLQHSMWSKELVASYKKLGYKDRILPLHLETWELYKDAIGAESEVTLEWARAAVCIFKEQGRHEEALQFWQTVRCSLDPASARYIAWSRHMMHMYKRQNRNAEALTVTAEVWRNIQPEVTGYRAWTAQLSEQYEAAGRSNDAIAVCESAWTAINQRLEHEPNSDDWKFQLRGAGFMLANAYRRHGRVGEADAVEERCDQVR